MKTKEFLTQRKRKMIQIKVNNSKIWIMDRRREDREENLREIRYAIGESVRRFCKQEGSI